MTKPSAEEFAAALANIRRTSPQDARVIDAYVTRWRRLLARHNIDPAADPGPISPTVEFISNDGEHLMNVPEAEIDASIGVIVADLLDHAADSDYVTSSISVLTLIEGVPAALILGAALRTVLVGLVGPLQAGVPGIRETTAAISNTLRSEQEG